MPDVMNSPKTHSADWWGRGLGAAGLLVAGLGLYFQYLDRPAPEADLRISITPQDMRFIQRPGKPGEVGAVPLITITNDGASSATGVWIDYQHGVTPPGWSGMVPNNRGLPSLKVGPRDSLLFPLWADTAADPGAWLQAGKRLHFALRLRWTNESTSRPGCTVSYLDIHEAAGPNSGDRLLVVDVLADPPADFGPSDVGRCPA